MRFFRAFLSVLLMVSLSACSKPEDTPAIKSTTPSFDFLERMTLDEVNRAIEHKENLYLYFGWTKNSKECMRLQEQFLEPNIDYYGWNGLIRVVDLDEEMPAALEDKAQRSVLMQDYNIRYAPSFVFVKFGEVSNVFEWTPETNDLVNGVDLEALLEWMRLVGLIK